jgi:CDP-4-dehydro-6-deoxyglucose reductase
MPLIEIQTGQRFEATPEESLLDAALRAGLSAAYSCRTGRCNTCKCRVLEGDTAGLQPETALDPNEAAQGYVLGCSRSARGDLRLELPLLPGPPLPPARHWPSRISSLEPLAADVLRVRLRLPPTAALRFEAGQYVDVQGPDGQRRSYSIANVDAGQPQIELHIRQVPGGALSEHWFGRAKPNDLLRLHGPLGTFVLRELGGLDLVFLATGTGFAPVQAMLQALPGLAPEAQPRSVTLYWGGRQAADLYLAPECGHTAWRYVPVLSRAEAGWTGARGHVQQVLLAEGRDLARCAVYACGSEAMVNDARRALLAAGLPASRFHADAFVCSAERSATP